MNGIQSLAEMAKEIEKLKADVNHIESRLTLDEEMQRNNWVRVNKLETEIQTKILSLHYDDMTESRAAGILSFVAIAMSVVSIIVAILT